MNAEPLLTKIAAVFAEHRFEPVMIGNAAAACRGARHHARFRFSLSQDASEPQETQENRCFTECGHRQAVLSSL